MDGRRVDRRCTGGGGHPRRLAGGGDGDAGDRHVAHGQKPGNREKVVRSGNAGVHHGDLLRQDRHADAEPDDGACRMVCGDRFTVIGEGYAPQGEIHYEKPLPDLRTFFLPMVLCAESRVCDGRLIGDPTEGALWVLAQKQGIDPEYEQDEQPRIAEIPFDSAHKFMATFHHAGERVEMFIKGAPDVLLARSSAWLDAKRESALTADVRNTIEEENAHLASQALRVLAVARRFIPAHDFYPAGDLMALAKDCGFLGLAGLLDPPLTESKQAI